MGLWGRKVCDNLAPKRDTESVSSQTPNTEITGLVHMPYLRVDARVQQMKYEIYYCQKMSEKSNMPQSQTFIHTASNVALFNFILPKIQLIKIQLCDFKVLFITIQRSVLWIKLHCHCLLTFITLLAMGRAELNTTGNGWLYCGWSAQALLWCHVRVPSGKKRHKIEYIKCSDCSHPGPGGETSDYSRSAVKPGQQQHCTEAVIHCPYTRNCCNYLKIKGDMCSHQLSSLTCCLSVHFSRSQAL